MNDERDTGHPMDERGADREILASEMKGFLGLYSDLRSRFGPEQTRLRAERIARESVILALRGLTEGGCWVGDEGRLIAELRARAREGAGDAGKLPSSLLELHVRFAAEQGLFHDADLEVLDHREVSHDFLEYWREEVGYLPGASRWGPQAPVLVCRRSPLPPVEYYPALRRILSRWDPFPLTLLLFAEGDGSFGPAGRWTGPTHLLVNALRGFYPTFDKVSYDLASLSNPSGVRGCLPDYQDIHEYGRLFEPSYADDYSLFHERLLASVPVLQEVGIRVRRVDLNEESGGAANPDPSRSEWIVEALPWYNPRFL